VSDAMPLLAGWENFYVIVGSSGAALIGLQFVVLALIADSTMRRSLSTINAFGSPVVVHLGSALVISALMSAPWQTLGSAALALAIFGVAGLAYSVNVFQRARRQDAYTPVLEDWIFHITLPCLAYVALTVAAIVLRGAPRGALFAVAASALGLLLIGIRNAWDTIVYVVLGDAAGGAGDKPKK
jgi:hypothetical protein